MIFADRRKRQITTLICGMQCAKVSHLRTIHLPTVLSLKQTALRLEISSQGDGLLAAEADIGYPDTLECIKAIGTAL